MNNKHGKEKTMRKIAMVIGILSVLATSAQAGYWSHTPSFNGGWNSTYFYTPYELLQKYSN